MWSVSEVLPESGVRTEPFSRYRLLRCNTEDHYAHIMWNITVVFLIVLLQSDINFLKWTYEHVILPLLHMIGVRNNLFVDHKWTHHSLYVLKESFIRADCFLFSDWVEAFFFGFSHFLNKERTKNLFVWISVVAWPFFVYNAKSVIVSASKYLQISTNFKTDLPQCITLGDFFLFLIVFIDFFIYVILNHFFDWDPYNLSDNFLWYIWGEWGILRIFHLAML